MRAAESLGPQRATIPDVVGESDRAAEINIHRRGLDIGSVMTAHIPGLPLGQVVGQNPLPNASGVESPKLNLLLNAPDAQPAFVMPEFVGHRIGEAARAIDEAGLKLPAAEAEALKRTAGTAIILHQSPAPGQKVLAGSVVNFDLAGEPPVQPVTPVSDAQPPSTPPPPPTTPPAPASPQ
jgi:beta-lactam-binding protein with PASTA domain